MFVTCFSQMNKLSPNGILLNRKTKSDYSYNNMNHYQNTMLRGQREGPVNKVFPGQA